MHKSNAYYKEQKKQTETRNCTGFTKSTKK